MNVGREKIEYYSNQKAAEKSDNASGTIDLVNFRGIKKFDNITFQLDGGSDGVFLLRADSNAEVACWINGLEIYLKEKTVRTAFYLYYLYFLVLNCDIFDRILQVNL